VKKNKRMTNADWVKNAKNYDLLDDQPVTATATATATTTSSHAKSSIPIYNAKKVSSNSASANAPPAQIIVQKKESSDQSKSLRDKKKKNARRRRANSSSSEDSHGSDHGHLDVRRKYEEGVEERRYNRDREHDKRGGGRRRDRSSSSNSIDKDSRPRSDGAKHVSDDESKLTKEQRAEMDRERDIRERDEFAKRLLERDKKKPSKGKDSEDGEGGDENQKRLDMEERLARGETIYDENTGDRITLQNLRDESRSAYLKKRTERELTLLERELEDEDEMFDADKLTEAEKRRLELRREVLKLAKGDKSKDDKNDGFYRLPDEYDELEGKTKAEKDNALLKSRYVEEVHEKSEQQLWEEEQTKKAVIGYGKKDKNRDEKEYGLVFEDQIDFVMTDKKKGYDHRKEKYKRRRRRRDDGSVSSRSVSIGEKEETAAIEIPMTKHEKILVGRKKLPVFPYREEFLAAVKDHQVLILVGETGSGKT